MYFISTAFVELAEMDHAQNEKVIREFGEHLKKVRLSKKMSLRKLAHEADMSHNAINEIEKGIVDTSLSTIYRLAAALGIDPADLMRK